MKQKINFLLLGIIFIFLFMRPILIFLIPGIIIFIFHKKNILETMIHSIALSLSFWVSTFWFLKFIPLHLTTFFNIIFLLTIIILIFNSNKIKIKPKKEELIILSLFFIIALLRFLPFFLNFFPASADMSFHTLTSKIIIINNKFPSTYEPVLPIKFGAYPTGFHSLIAYLALISNLQEYRAALLITNFTYFFLTLSLFLFLKNYFNYKVSFIGSVITTFLANNPQFFISWGGNPFVLSLGFLIMALPLIEKFPFRTKKDIILLALILSASFLTHVLPVYAFFYIYLPLFLYKIKDLILKKLSYVVKSTMLLVIIFLVFVSPFLLSFNYKTSKAEKEWIINRQKNKFLSWKGNLKNFYITIPAFLIILFGKEFLILIISGIFFLIENKKLFLKIVSIITTNILLIINYPYQLLPLSYILLTERVAILLIVPFSIVLAYFIKVVFYSNFIKKKIIKNKILRKVLIFFILFTLLTISMRNYLHYIRISDSFSMLTKEDIEAFEWIKNNIKEETLFLNNYGDAGLWLPSITLRKIRTMHIIPAYFEEAESYLKNLKPEYIYIGKKLVYSANINIEQIKDKQLIYAKDSVYIYKLK